MANTILDKLNMTQAELESAYHEAGSYRELANRLNVSKTSLVKYLSHIAHDTKPWAARNKNGRQSRSKDYLRRKYREEVQQQFEEALLTRRDWTDVNGTTYPTQAIIFHYEPPRLMIPSVPVYGTIRGTGRTAVFIFKPEIEWLTAPGQEEHSSDEATPDNSPPAQQGPSLASQSQA